MVDSGGISVSKVPCAWNNDPFLPQTTFPNGEHQNLKRERFEGKALGLGKKTRKGKKNEEKKREGTCAPAGNAKRLSLCASQLTTSLTSPQSKIRRVSSCIAPPQKKERGMDATDGHHHIFGNGKKPVETIN